MSQKKITEIEDSIQELKEIIESNNSLDELLIEDIQYEISDLQHQWRKLTGKILLEY